MKQLQVRKGRCTIRLQLCAHFYISLLRITIEYTTSGASIFFAHSHPCQQALPQFLKESLNSTATILEEYSSFYRARNEYTLSSTIRKKTS